MPDKSTKIKYCGKCKTNYAGTRYRHNLTCAAIVNKDFKPASELIENDKRAASEVLPIPDAAQSPSEAPTKTIADIEKELLAEAKPVAAPATAGVTPTREVDKNVTSSAANIIYIRYAYKFVNSTLNKVFKTNDFDMTDDELKKLEDATLATLAYYKVQLTPPIVLCVVLFCAYVLPILKHVGIIDKIKEAWKKDKEAKKTDDKKDGVK